MKDKSRQSHMFGKPTPPPSEKKRLVIMTIAFVLLLAAFIANMQRMGGKEIEGVPQTVQAPEVKVQLPELRSAELNDLVADKTKAGRALIEPKALQLAMDDASKLAEPHYRAMDVINLDAAVLQTLQADPSTARLKPYRLRGEVRTLRTRELPSGQAYASGSVRLDDGSFAHFLTLNVPEDLKPGQWVRMNGLFVKLYTDEVDGQWVDGALLAGRTMIDSVAPLFDPSAPLTLAEDGVGTFTNAELQNVVTDEVQRGLGYLPFLEKWKILARAARADEEPIDWSQVPILDEANMDSIMADPDAWRGLPVRLPLDGAALLASTASPAEENPARLPYITDGYLFEHAWKNNAEVVHFLYPGKLEINGDDWNGDPTVMGRGFYFKNLTYMTRENRLSLTPVLVLSQVTAMDPPEPGAYGKLLYGVLGLSVLIIVGIFLLLRREKQRSQEFQERRVKRQREKRRSANAT